MVFIKVYKNERMLFILFCYFCQAKIFVPNFDLLCVSKIINWYVKKYLYVSN